MGAGNIINYSITKKDNIKWIRLSGYGITGIVSFWSEIKYTSINVVRLKMKHNLTRIEECIG